MGSTNSKSPQGPQFADDFFGRSHRRLERPLRKQFASGVKYNMKVVIRGDSGTGKSTLLGRLHAYSVQKAMAEKSRWFWSVEIVDDEHLGIENPSSYVPTRQIQVANLKWKYRGTDDVIKVEVWDVVDHGLCIHQKSSTTDVHGAIFTEENKVGVADADAVDVYKHANGVILVFNLSKPRSMDYVVRELPKVPPDLPVLILGNFADKTYTQEDESFLLQRFSAARGETNCPLHFISGSLTQPNCPRNPPSGLLKALLKFFELPFLQLQRSVLVAKLKINEEQIERAQKEWRDLVSPTEERDVTNMTMLTMPEAARTCTNLGSLESISTDTLTLQSKIAWNDSCNPVITPDLSKSNW